MAAISATAAGAVLGLLKNRKVLLAFHSVELTSEPLTLLALWKSGADYHALPQAA
jgi:hypothetical protein